MAKNLTVVMLWENSNTTCVLHCSWLQWFNNRLLQVAVQKPKDE